MEVHGGIVPKAGDRVEMVPPKYRVLGVQDLERTVRTARIEARRVPTGIEVDGLYSR